YPDTHNVHGHDHSVSEAHHTKRDGKVLGSYVVGALCRTDGVIPSYWSAVDDRNQPVYHHENWQASVAVVSDFRNGEYEFESVMINDGRAYWRGEEYVAEEA